MYNAGQHYPRNSQPHYPSAWDKESSQQSYGPPPGQLQGGPVCNNQSQMPPPPHHFSHHLQMAVSSPSQSPRSWSMPQHSPRATPSPMAMQNVSSPSLSNRSSVTGKQFSPSPVMSSVNPAFEFQSHNATNSSPSPSNNHLPSSASPSMSATSTLVNSNDPLQSLQKMVMIESRPGESPIERTNYEVSSNSSLPSAPIPKCGSDFSNVEQLASNEDADSPGPTYYNLDEGRTINSKVHCAEETSRGNYTSEHGVGDPHFSTVPPMEHMGYSHPVNGIPMEEQNSYHPVHHNGYPQHMYQQNPYCTNGTMQQRPPRKKSKKNVMNPGDMHSPGKRKGRASPVEGYNSNYYSGSMLPDYQNAPYDPSNPPLALNGPSVVKNGPAEMMPVFRKRTYTKRAKVNKKEYPTQNPTNHASIPPGEVLVSENSADATSSETSMPKRKSSPRQKISDVGKSEIANSITDASFVKGQESSVAGSISSFDGPVKITRIPNMVGNGDQTTVDSDVSTANRTSKIEKIPIMKEVSVKIVPLPACSIMRNSLCSEKAPKRENGFESISNSPCSSNTSSVPNTANQERVKDSSANDSNSNATTAVVVKRKRGRPKKTDAERISKPRKEKVVKNVEPKVIEVKKVEDKHRTLFGPYVHIEGTHDNPVAITVINTQAKDEDNKVSKMKQKKSNKHLPHSFNPKRKLGHSSTLSAGYDTVTKDKSWLCILCRKCSHCDDLGDLYGPYYNPSLHVPTSTTCSPNTSKVTNNCESDSSTVSPNQRTSGRLRRRRSDVSDNFVYTSCKSSKQVRLFLVSFNS